MPTLSTFLLPALPFLRAGTFALGAILASVLLFRGGLQPLVGWLYRGRSDRAPRVLQRLNKPYVLASLLTAAQAFRGLFGERVDWWLGALLIPAITVVAIELIRQALVDTLLAPRSGRAVPKILRDIAFGVIYATTFLAYLGSVFKVDLAPFLTTSAILSVVIGMALQDTLGNLFAGLAINLDRPFELDDWIMIEGQVGRVVEITWRATKIVTRRHEMIIIPNNALAKTKVQNFGLPQPRYAEAIDLQAPYDTPPHRLKEIVVSVAATVRGVLADPAPEVRLLQFGDSGIVYEILLWIEDCGDAPRLRSQFQESLWYHFQREGISLPYPTRTVEMADLQGRRDDQMRENVRALRRLDVISCMDPASIEVLARKARLVHFGPGERIFTQGDPGESLYIIKRGRVVLSLDERGGRDTRPFAHLEEGDFFGEMSLLTGEARTASAHADSDGEFLVLEHHHLAPLLEDQPDFMRRISLTIAERRQNMMTAKVTLAHERENVALHPHANQAVEETSNEILGRIRAFFKLS